MIKDFALNLRPRSLNDLCGQKLIVSEFKKRSLTNDFPSVMIFGGESGTGKTTTALILGALMNEDNPLKGDGFLDPNPDSPEYQSIYNDRYNRNVTMYDASKMGKEDVLALEDVVGASSLFGGEKVVIIDECQELGRYSKGATLKLLEKKRENVHIILCTMNPDSIDKSIRSRGQYYQFKSPSSTDIAEYLYGLCKKLEVEIPDIFLEQGLFTIGENCEGSVRMAVQTLERCLLGGLYSEEDIQKEFGYLSQANLANCVSLLLKRKPEAFESIKGFDIKDYFYQSQKLLTECLFYYRTGLCDTDWKKRQYDAFKPFKKEVEELCNLYWSIEKEMGAYFKNSYCLVRLTEFLTTPSGLSRVQEPTGFAPRRAAPSGV